MANSDAAPVPGSPEYLAKYSGGTLLGISIAFMILTTGFVALRFYARTMSVTPFAIDDAFILAAYIVNLGLSSLGILMVKLADVGYHEEAVLQRDPAKLVMWARILWVFEVFYFTTVALPKAGIVLLYMRLFGWKGRMRAAAVALLVLIGATFLSLLLAACFQCRPLAYWWNRLAEGRDDDSGGVCFNVQAFYRAQTIPGSFLDMLTIVLPIHTIWGLKLPTAKRLALVGIFAVGSFGIVASIVRAVKFFNTAAFTDPTWASVPLSGWSIIETSTYIITACLPHFRPLISRHSPAWLKKGVRRLQASATHTFALSLRSRAAAGATTATKADDGAGLGLVVSGASANRPPSKEMAQASSSSPVPGTLLSSSSAQSGGTNRPEDAHHAHAENAAADGGEKAGRPSSGWRAV